MKKKTIKKNKQSPITSTLTSFEVGFASRMDGLVILERSIMGKQSFLEKHGLIWKDIIMSFFWLILYAIMVLSMVGFLPRVIFPVCCLVFSVFCFVHSSHNTIIIGLVFVACAIIEFVKLYIL